MRRNILIIISFLTLLVSSGCTNLDEKWYSEVTPDTYFTSKETVLFFLGTLFHTLALVSRIRPCHSSRMYNR